MWFNNNLYVSFVIILKYTWLIDWLIAKNSVRGEKMTNMRYEIHLYVNYHFKIFTLFCWGAIFVTNLRTFFGIHFTGLKIWWHTKMTNVRYRLIIPHICHFFSTYPIFYKKFLHAKARKSRQNGSHKNSVKQTLWQKTG